MDPEKRARRKNLRLIITEAIMVLTVVITVTILALIVSGYWLNSSFEVERQGMLQISSVPTDAIVSVDGESPWFQHTNTSKVLTSGEHEIALTKNGYDSWTKKITIREGLLYRLNYPRLFLQNRFKENVFDDGTSNFTTVSPNHKLLLLAYNTTNWDLIDLNNEKIEAKTLDIAKAFGITTQKEHKAELFDYKILSADWDADSNHILFKIQNNDGEISWVLFDVKNPDNSLNITKEFAADFTEVKIMGGSSSELLVVRNNNLHKINVSNKHISAVIVPNVQSFDHFGSEIVFVASTSDLEESDEIPEDSEYYVGLIESGNDKINPLIPATKTTKILLSEFYGEKYITAIEDQALTLYKKEKMEKIFSDNLAFVPAATKIGHDGEFVFMNSDTEVATLDMEAMLIRAWELPSTNYGWLDNNMVYAVSDGTLNVYDFDGLNHRQLANSVSDRFPVVITEDKWLYYFSDGRLIREWLINR